MNRTHDINATSFEGNNFDIQLQNYDSAIKADLMLSEKSSVRIWGRVKDRRGCPVEGALLKLIKQTNNCRNEDYIGVAHTVSDCQGFYQFEIEDYQGGFYKVIVSKTSVERERVIHSSNCDPCHKSDPYHKYGDKKHYDYGIDSSSVYGIEK